MTFLPTMIVAVTLLGAADAEQPSALASAGTPPAVSADAPSRWYGWQLLASDAVTAGLWAVAVHENTSGPLSPALYLTGWGTYALGASVIHVANGRRDVAVRRGLLRAAAPPLGLVLALSIAFSRACDGGSSEALSDRCWYGAWAALLAPVVATSIYDIATAETPAPANAWPRRPPATVAWTPTFAPSPNGATLGFAGRF